MIVMAPSSVFFLRAAVSPKRSKIMDNSRILAVVIWAWCSSFFNTSTRCFWFDSSLSSLSVLCELPSTRPATPAARELRIVIKTNLACRDCGAP